MEYAKVMGVKGLAWDLKGLSSNMEGGRAAI